jgi:hypothetical protein
LFKCLDFWSGIEMWDNEVLDEFAADQQWSYR